MEDGFLKLSRRFFSNVMWNEARTFSSCEAWLDLMQSARFDATPRMESIGGREVSYSRGQYPASIRFLSKRWQWSEKRVRCFLNHLKKNGEIDVDNTQGMNIITICHYDEYWVKGTPRGTTKGTTNEQNNSELDTARAQLGAQPRAQLQDEEEGHSKGTNSKKEKKENTTDVVSKKDAAIAATKERKHLFGLSLVPFVEKYGKEMIRDFFDYWSESNKSGSKMKFEMQKTWELSLRLATWERRKKQYERPAKNTGGSIVANAVIGGATKEGINPDTESLTSWINSIPIGK